MRDLIKYVWSYLLIHTCTNNPLKKNVYELEEVIPSCTHLSEHWLIHLIMAVLPVADQVNDDVLVEGLSPLCSHLTHMNNSLWVIGIHMEDGSRHHLCVCVCTRFVTW